MTHVPLRTLVAALCATLPCVNSLASDAHSLVPWLDVPDAWPRHIENGVIIVSPHDLLPGRSLVLKVEPSSVSSETPLQAYERAIRDLGPWKPVGNPLDQTMDNGCVFRHGVGVPTMEGRRYTGHIAIARWRDQLVRMWILADSDDTYNRYKSAIVTAIASMQDIAGTPTDAAPGTPVSPRGETAPTPAPGPGAVPSGLDPRFGQGLSGVYVGIERGVTAGASMGSTVRTQIGDYAEVDVFFPDGTYRRRLPVRGLASDMNWERLQQPTLWGSWRRQGNQVIAQRGSYATSYTLDGETLISSRGRPWEKLPMSSDMRIDGTYARDDFREPDAPRLVLRADGTYEDRGGFLRMVGSAWHLIVPDGDTMISRWSDAQARQAMAGGGGTYTFGNFTLTLRDRDSRVWQINAYIPAGEIPPKPHHLVINGRALLRD